MDVEKELSPPEKMENTFEALPSFNDLDFLNINKEINTMMVEINEELGDYDIIFNHQSNNYLTLINQNNFNSSDNSNLPTNPNTNTSKLMILLLKILLN